MIRPSFVIAGLTALLALGCGSGDETPLDRTQMSFPPQVLDTATPVPTAPTPTLPRDGGGSRTPGAAPATVPSIRATHLRIPSLGIDAQVQESHEVPDAGVVPAGCPAEPPGTTVSVPDQGIATPVQEFEGLDGRSWIYGHSRWLGEPGLFFAIQSLEVGNELFVDGVDRATGAPVVDQRFVVERLYVSDTDAGAEVVFADTSEEIPEASQVILQTSVRVDGPAGTPPSAWILDRETLLAKSEVLTEDGSLDDPCKYLLFFVVASGQ